MAAARLPPGESRLTRHWGKMTMSGADLLEVWSSAGDKIDNLWQMYIVVHLGLFWFFFLVHRPLLIVERLIAVFAYVVFAYINGNALIKAYQLFEAMRSDLVTKYARDFAQAPETLRMLSSDSYAGRDELIWLTHMGGFTLVLCLFIMRNVMIRRYFAAYPELSGLQSKVTD
jgi:hypothetical protein